MLNVIRIFVSQPHFICSFIISTILICFPVSDAAWFDSTSALDSECDDEFYSVYDGMSVFSPSPPKFGLSEVLTNNLRLQFWLCNVEFLGVCQGSHHCKFGCIIEVFGVSATATRSHLLYLSAISHDIKECNKNTTTTAI